MREPILVPNPFMRPTKTEDLPHWEPQKGSQELFLTCPTFEVLYEGTRGPGKTDALIMDFYQDVGAGWGAEWRGILFRQTYPQLADVIAKTKKWFKLLCPGAKYNESKNTWTFPDGEQLLLRHMKDPEDYWNYHGHSYPWIGWEELTSWPSKDCYTRMLSCCRSTVGADKRDKFGRAMPRKYRSTTNPYGPGHNWVKKRWRLPDYRGIILKDEHDADGNKEPPRVAIHGTIYENRILLDADPDYILRIAAAARNDAERAAWLHGSWNITSGGMFDDIFEAGQHVLEPFSIPNSWPISRSFDWGSARPFSVGWWATSDGTDVQLADGTYMSTVRGDSFRVGEWYGCVKGKPNTGLLLTSREITIGIIEREIEQGFRLPDGSRGRVRQGPADPAIFSTSTSNRKSIADDLKKPVRFGVKLLKGTSWDVADNSRKSGWEAMRQRLQNSLLPENGVPREKPGLFIFRTCKHWIEQVPTIPRDANDPDDVDTDTEDHIADETRYYVNRTPRVMRVSKTTGMH